MKNTSLEQNVAHLPERITTILVRSAYAGLVGRELSTRRDYLIEIASLHTRAELLAQPGLGHLGVLRIEKWLAFHGCCVRDVGESLDSVICRFSFARALVLRRGRRSSRSSTNMPPRREKFSREASISANS